MEQTNQAMEATWGIALKIWWWLIWRSLLTALVGGSIIGFIIGFILGIISVITKINFIDTMRLPILAIGFIFGMIVNIFFIKRVIGKKFKNFSLMLIKTV